VISSSSEDDDLSQLFHYLTAGHGKLILQLLCIVGITVCIYFRAQIRFGPQFLHSKYFCFKFYGPVYQIPWLMAANFYIYLFFIQFIHITHVKCRIVNDGKSSVIAENHDRTPYRADLSIF